MRVRTSHGTLQTLYRAVLALWPPKASQQAQQRWGPLLHWLLKGAEVVVGPVSVMAHETVGEAESEVEVVLEDEVVSELGSAAEFVFDAGAVRQRAFWASELVEVDVLLVLEGLGVVQSPLI